MVTPTLCCMETKSSLLRSALASGDVRRAVSIASKFPRLGEIRGAVLDAQMAFTNPAFCRGIKKDPAALIAAGHAALAAKFGPGSNPRSIP